MKNILLILVFIFSIQGLFAQKVLNTYGGFTATDIKNRASVPLQADIVVNGSAVECRNITTTNIKNVLGESTTGIGALSLSPNANKWSGFGPREWYTNAGVLTDRAKIPYQFGNFAGYNHNAIKPIILDASLQYQSIGGSVVVNVPIVADLEELNISDISTNYNFTHFKIHVYDGTSLVASSTNKPLSLTGNFDVPLSVALNGVYTKTYTTKIAFCMDEESDFGYILDEVDGSINLSVTPQRYSRIIVNAEGYLWPMPTTYNAINNTLSMTSSLSENPTYNNVVFLNYVNYSLYNIYSDALESSQDYYSLDDRETPSAIDYIPGQSQTFTVLFGDPIRMYPSSTQYLIATMYYKY